MFLIFLFVEAINDGRWSSPLSVSSQLKCQLCFKESAFEPLSNVDLAACGESSFTNQEMIPLVLQVVE